MEKLLSCPICHEPFDQAVELSCCSKCYCQQCIEKWINSQSTCPSCRMPLSSGQWKENRPLQTLVNDLPAICSYTSSGCTSVLTRGIVKEHESKCDYAHIECPDGGSSCPKILRKDLLDHERHCAWKKVDCSENCGVTELKASQLAHHLLQCPLVEVSCQYCDSKMKRSEMEAHNEACRLSKACPFVEFGCTQDDCDDIDSHLTQNSASHLLYACSAIRKLQEQNALLQEKIDKLEQKLASTIINSPAPQHPSPSSLIEDNHTIVQTVEKPAEAPKEVVPLISNQSQTDEIEQIKKFNKEKELLKETAENNLNASTQGQDINKINSSEPYPPSTSLEIGLKLVSALPPEAQPVASKLVAKPQLMIECFIMNQRFDCLDALYDFMPSVMREDLFFTYVKKALDFKSTNYETQIKVGLEAIKGPNPVVENVVVQLTGDVSYDAELRAGHKFPDTPRSDIALKLLRYCDERKAGYFTVSLCESFDSYVTGFASYTYNLKVVEAMVAMLKYGKLLFSKNPIEFHSGIIELCDSFLTHLELMIQIVNTKAPVQVQLADFGDANKVRAIRDKLIEFGSFETARDLCLRTQVPSEAVSVAWAMSLIKQEKFPEARQMLQPILTKVNHMKQSQQSSRSAPKLLSSQSKGVDSQMIVDNIIQIIDPLYPKTRPRLGSGPSSSSTNNLNADRRKTAIIPTSLSQRSFETVKKMPDMSSSPIRFSLEATTTASAELKLSTKVEECLYYLENYGSASSYVKFLLRHNLLEKVCAFILNNELDPDLFIDKVVAHCSSNSLLGELKHALLTVDPTLSKSRIYLVATCKMLNEQKSFKTLVTFQIFMKDYVRAALTCIRVFMDTEDTTFKTKSLEVARDYFQVALKDASTTRPPSGKLDPSGQTKPGAANAVVMTSSEINSYLHKIEIQLEVIKFLPDLLSTKLSPILKIPGIEQFTLFGPQIQRNTIAWILLVYNLDLGLKVLTETIRREEWPYVFTNAGMHAARQLSEAQALALIEKVKSAGADSEWQDLLVKSELEVFALERKDSKTGEKLAKMLSNPTMRCMGLIDCGKLKAAYLEAVKLPDNISIMGTILGRATQQEDQSVVKLCTNYIEQFKNKK